MSEYKTIALVSVNELLLAPLDKDLDVKEYINEGHEFAYGILANVELNRYHICHLSKKLETSDAYKGLRQYNHMPILHSITEIQGLSDGRIFRNDDNELRVEELNKHLIDNVKDIFNCKNNKDTYETVGYLVNDDLSTRHFFGAILTEEFIEEEDECIDKGKGICYEIVLMIDRYGYRQYQLRRLSKDNDVFKDVSDIKECNGLPVYYGETSFYNECLPYGYPTYYLEFEQ